MRRGNDPDSTVSSMVRRISRARDVAGDALKGDLADWHVNLVIWYEIGVLQRFADGCLEELESWLGPNLTLLLNGEYIEGSLMQCMSFLRKHAYVQINSQQLRLALRKFASKTSVEEEESWLDGATTLEQKFNSSSKELIQETSTRLRARFRARVCLLTEEQCVQLALTVLEKFTAEYEGINHRIMKMRAGMR